MVESRHYRHAPITEAIIDLRVKSRAEIRLDELKELRSGEEDSYPHQEKMFKAVGQLEVRPEVSASASATHEQTGFKFASGDRKHIWQSRMDGFTFSRLAPYESWQPFRDEARRLWTRYRQCMEPSNLIRLAVRYVNRIDIPGDAVDLKDYFRTSPEVSQDLPQQLAGFFMQVRIAQEDHKAQMLINQTAIPPAREAVVSVVLDVDLFRSDEVPSEEEEIWDFFDKLHIRKNEIFEACITDRTRELIQ